jgi:hypothetical protein
MYTLLSTTALDMLREYWRYYRPQEWLFEGRLPARPLTGRSIQRVLIKAKKVTGTRWNGLSIPSLLSSRMVLSLSQATKKT